MPTFDTGAQPQATEPQTSGRPRRRWRRKPKPAAPDPSPAEPTTQLPPAGPRTELGAEDAPSIEAIPVPSTGAPAAPPAEVASEPIPPAAHSVTVPGRYYYLKWWQLVLVIAAVWIPAAVIGVALFSWWYSLPDKAPAVFVVLIYVVVCTVVGLMMAMVQSRPLVSALAIAVMTAVFASAAAASPLYGHYYCQVHHQQGGHCLAGIIPY
ncbi:hypothetical protein A5707_19675 [Mycobacterium kyorinense]|uniref:Transmembrane protein n=1 Tax=Mycobacterium kyorinense TaxID=487514 RepID=A0A1A2ZA29_9MYCO|nr:hypothetical protein [Mycobacterium kyorinense]OBI47494.1 hypothetical protein A5707_19675 [Mycobacterium kyorinense]